MLVESQYNNTSTPLEISNEFVGRPELVSQYNAVHINVALQGNEGIPIQVYAEFAKFQQFHDDWMVSELLGDISDDGETHHLDTKVKGRYFRLRLVNTRLPPTPETPPETPEESEEELPPITAEKTRVHCYFTDGDSNTQITNETLNTVLHALDNNDELEQLRLNENNHLLVKHEDNVNTVLHGIDVMSSQPDHVNVENNQLHCMITETISTHVVGFDNESGPFSLRVGNDGSIDCNVTNLSNVEQFLENIDLSNTGIEFLADSINNNIENIDTNIANIDSHVDNILQHVEDIQTDLSSIREDMQDSNGGIFVNVLNNELDVNVTNEMLPTLLHAHDGNDNVFLSCNPQGGLYTETMNKTLLTASNGALSNTVSGMRTGACKLKGFQAASSAGSKTIICLYDEGASPAATSTQRPYMLFIYYHLDHRNYFLRIIQ